MQDFTEVFKLDPNSPSGLSWKVGASSKKVNDFAGYFHKGKKKYFVSYKGKQYSAKSVVEALNTKKPVAIRNSAKDLKTESLALLMYLESNPNIDALKVGEFAGKSRFYVHYLLQKLTKDGFLYGVKDKSRKHRGPKPTLYRLSEKGKHSLQELRSHQTTTQPTSSFTEKPTSNKEPTIFKKLWYSFKELVS